MYCHVQWFYIKVKVELILYTTFVKVFQGRIHNPITHQKLEFFQKLFTLLRQIFLQKNPSQMFYRVLNMPLY